MTTAVILAGGSGIRLGSSIPKQFIPVNDKPVIMYSVMKFQQHEGIDRIVIVISPEWEASVKNWLDKYEVDKFLCFAPAGKSRQHSIYNGLIRISEAIAKDSDIVIVHDAARPLVSDEIISQCIEMLENYDAAMPVLSVKDTVYFSDRSGSKVENLLERDRLFAGQAPESFRFGAYYEYCKSLSDEELSTVRGTTEAAFRCGMSIGLFTGSEDNFKITTMNDLKKFTMMLKDGAV